MLLDQANESVTTMFVEQPLALPGSANELIGIYLDQFPDLPFIFSKTCLSLEIAKHKNI